MSSVKFSVQRLLPLLLHFCRHQDLNVLLWVECESGGSLCNSHNCPFPKAKGNNGFCIIHKQVLFPGKPLSVDGSKQEEVGDGLDLSTEGSADEFFKRREKESFKQASNH